MLYSFLIFFFNDTATTEIYTLSLHDALPICQFRVRDRSDVQRHRVVAPGQQLDPVLVAGVLRPAVQADDGRSEEHTSELQSPCNLVCRLLLEKKKKNNMDIIYSQHMSLD